MEVGSDERLAGWPRGCTGFVRGAEVDADAVDGWPGREGMSASSSVVLC
jgi:hypothetical protein